MTRVFGIGDDFGEDDLLGKLEGMKDVIEQVNRQFKDPVRPLMLSENFYELFTLHENSSPEIYYPSVVTRIYECHYSDLFLKETKFTYIYFSHASYILATS